jgi:hypothetical protein
MLPKKNSVTLNSAHTMSFHAYSVKFIAITVLMVHCGMSMAQDESSKRKGSRIIDDTTKQIYGPTTSRYYFERDAFYNREVLYPIDTIIRNFHRYNYVQENNNFYQDLGNIGTAITPLFYEAPDVIGARSGFNAYNLYWDTEQIKYYDTKSPYSNMKVIIGGKGRSITRATFSRNISPQWNFGLTYRGIFIDKQIQRTGKGDRHARSHYYDFYTAFQSKDSTYRLFANVRRNYHEVNEYGGVLLEFDSIYAQAFTEDALPWLTGASSNDLRMNAHLFHQYSFSRGFQVYHILDRYRQGNSFQSKGKLPEQFFPVSYHAGETVYDVTKFKFFRNEAGIKGSLSKLFYNGYYAIRHFSMTYFHLDESTIPRHKGNEMYVGGRVSLKLDSLTEVGGVAEVMPLEKGLHKIQGVIKSKWFEASVRQQLYKPSFVEQLYSGAYQQWDTTYKNNISSSQINGYLHYTSKVLKISPGITATRLNNYIFYKKQHGLRDTLEVIQSDKNFSIFSPEIRFSLTVLRHINISAQIINTRLLESAAEGITIPKYFVNSQLSYSNIFFNGNLDMHGGIDVHWKSEYNALGYEPSVQQFFMQNTFSNPAFPVIDLFFNAKIKRGRIFLKWNNLGKLASKTGYFPTPLYPGQKNVIDFGFDLSFYD